MKPNLGAARTAVAQLVGLECSQAQNSIGSILLLDFGMLRAMALENPSLMSGAWTLMVYSPWRLEDEDGAVADWNLQGGPNGSIGRLIATLANARVTSVEVLEPQGDLSVRFSTGHRLFVFVDSSAPGNDAWWLLGANGDEVAVAAPSFAADPPDHIPR